jgi:hypothetical protein
MRKLMALFGAGLLFAASGILAAQTKTTSKAAKATKAGSEAAEKPKQHQATGTVVSFTDTNLMMAKGQGKAKSEWTFVRNNKTATRGTLAKDAKVTVFYHEEKGRKIAHRINVWPAPKGGEKPAKPGKPAAGKTKS